MPFSPAFKAGLVAVVLVILNHVPRLVAAPMYFRNPWTGALEEGSNVIRDHAGPSTATNFAPGTDRDRPHGYPVAGPSGANYAMQDAYFQHPDFPGNIREPTGRDSTWYYGQQTWTPAGTPNIGWEGAGLRSVNGWVVDQRPLTRFSPFESPQWLQLSIKDRAAGLNAEGQKFFSEERVKILRPLTIPGVTDRATDRAKKIEVREATEIYQQLVDAYLRIRFELQRRQMVRFDWKTNVLPTNLDVFTLTHNQARRHGEPLKSAEIKGGKGPLQPFILGDFEIYFFQEARTVRESLFEEDLDPKAFKVVGLELPKKNKPVRERIYLGEVTITPVEKLEKVKTQPGSSSRRSSA